MRSAAFALSFAAVLVVACSSTVDGGGEPTTPQATDDAGTNVCTKVTDTACYSGPAATRDVGECKSGFHSCAEEPCFQEITPANEKCETAADEDCDGRAPPCPAAIVAKRFGGAGGDSVTEMSIDGEGGITLVGGSGDVDFGTGVLKGSFVAKLAPDLTPRWSRGVAASSFAGRAAPDGSTFIAGKTTAAVDIGGGTTVKGAFLAKLGKTGDVVWAKSFGGENDDDTRVDAIAVSADGGSVAIAGIHDAAIDLGGGALATQGIFAARFDAAGTHLRSVNAGTGLGINYPRARAVAVANDGSLSVAGVCDRQIDFGAGYKKEIGGLDAFVARWSAAGTLVHGDVFGAGSNQYAGHVAFAADGSLLVSGGSDGSFVMGGASLAAGDWDHPFFVSLASTGEPLAGHAVAGDFDSYAGAVAADAEAGDGWLAAGSFAATVVIGGGKMTANDTDAWVAKLDANLVPTAGLRIGGKKKTAGSVVARGVARLPDGRIVVAGSFTSAVDLGAAVLETAGASDLFVAIFPSF